MVEIYANEQFPRRVVEFLRSLNHDVLTVQEADNRGLSDIVFTRQLLDVIVLLVS